MERHRRRIRRYLGEERAVDGSWTILDGMTAGDKWGLLGSTFIDIFEDARIDIFKSIS